MILKSFELERNIKSILNYKFVLIYGENIGLKEVFKKIKKSNHLNRLITLSPLTDMATKFHTRNGATLLNHNETSYNFEYDI